VLDLVTDELKQKLLPVNTRIKEIEKERDERRKVRKRTKKTQTMSMPFDRLGGPAPAASPELVVGGSGTVVADEMEVDNVVNIATDDEVDEGTIREREEEELMGLVHPDLKADVGANFTGLYELVGMQEIPSLSFND
jgi:ubiquitin carboxyl-terminal hydrolase 14